MTSTLLLTTATFLAACWLTRRFRRYALERRVLDIPNERSSHTVPTPRGGGMGIVLAALGALMAAAAVGLLIPGLAIGLIVSGAAVAGVGFIDDHRHMPRRWRLLVHLAAAAWVVAWCGAMPLPTGAEGTRWIVDALTVLYVAWVLNLTNFMDGIDGLAAVEAITVCVWGSIICATAAPGSGVTTASMIMAAAASGFLVWNWPPARIFMGDVGSGFIGITLAALSLLSGAAAPRLFWSWTILMAVFIVDATTTLIRRLMNGERIYDAHRSHAYQHAANRWGHRAVTATVGVINLAVLGPMALLVAAGASDGPTLALGVGLPLLALALWLGAGRRKYLPSGSSGTYNTTQFP